MRDLQAVANECMTEISTIGVPYGNVVEWKVNTRAQSRWGQCKRLTHNRFSINISSRLLDERVDLVGLKNTIIHELLHTIEYSDGHRGAWAKWAGYVNRKLGYNIKRTSSADEKGVPTELQHNKTQEYKYVVECPCCKHQWKRMVKSSLISHPEYYQCPTCKTKLQRIK